MIKVYDNGLNFFVIVYFLEFGMGIIYFKKKFLNYVDYG